MHLGYWYSAVLETGGICQRTPQVRPLVGFAPALSTWMLCMLVLQEQIPAHAGETFAKHPRFPRSLTWRMLKAKTFEIININNMEPI
jgi:hypothetical protein